MACIPPYVNGIAPSFCGCKIECVKCCPPPCCTSITLTYEIGPPYDEEETPEGCKCEDPTPAAPAPSAPSPTPGILARDAEEENWETVNLGTHVIPFPKFRNQIKDAPENFVFALAGSCSVPCETISIDLTTDGCCIEIVGQSGSNFGPNVEMRAVGDGNISASASQGACKFDLSINGTILDEETTDVFVTDGNTIVVAVSPKGESECCVPCWIDTQCTPKNFQFHKIFHRTRSIRKSTKNYLNIEMLKQRIEKLRNRRKS
jgi:hypothetical protein